MPNGPSTPATRCIDAPVVRKSWSSAIGHDKFSDDDDFFAIGGHSLLVARIMSGLGGQAGIRLPLRLFFDHPTVNSLAAAIAERVDASVRGREAGCR